MKELGFTFLAPRVKGGICESSQEYERTITSTTPTPASRSALSANTPLGNVSQEQFRKQILSCKLYKTTQRQNGTQSKGVGIIHRSCFEFGPEMKMASGTEGESTGSAPLCGLTTIATIPFRIRC